MFKNLTVKQRQRILIIGVAVVFIGLILAGSYFSEKRKEVSVQEKAKASKKMTLLTDRVEKDLWIAAEGQNIKALEKSNEELRFKLEQLAKEIDDTRREVKKKESTPKLPPVPPPRPISEKPKTEKTDPDFPPPEGFTSLPTGRQAFSPAKSPTSLKKMEKEKEKRLEPQGSSIRVFREEVSKEKKESEKKPGKDRKKEETTWLPSGSFMKAITLSGLDAPTSGGSQSEPYPVLLGVTDLSILPNRFKMNLRECFIIGAGYGNLSDERAYIRTETLSCVRNDGTVIDVSLKGHVVGEDGKLGMRGRLVSKQGQKIAMALVAGMIGSFGNAFRPQTATVLQLDSEEAGVFRYKFEDVLQAGALGGVGNTLNKVADYYLKMAERVFPIIEVDSGREVEVIVLKGQELKIQGGKR
jgi:conjugal transfer pilus assembly protein TraB